jgi:hypothetical protein
LADSLRPLCGALNYAEFPIGIRVLLRIFGGCSAMIR